MSDDLAETIKRYRNPYEPGYIADSMHRDAVTIANHYLSTLTAPTPVTLDALKARGFSLNGHSNYGWYTLKELVWVKVDTRFPASEWWWEDGHEDRIYPEPESMEEVEKLLTRLSRPKPQ